MSNHSASPYTRINLTRPGDVVSTRLVVGALDQIRADVAVVNATPGAPIPPRADDPLEPGAENDYIWIKPRDGLPGFCVYGKCGAVYAFEIGDTARAAYANFDRTIRARSNYGPLGRFMESDESGWVDVRREIARLHAAIKAGAK